jgi:hypothetical protein
MSDTHFSSFFFSYRFLILKALDLSTLFPAFGEPPPPLEAAAAARSLQENREGNQFKTRFCHGKKILFREQQLLLLQMTALSATASRSAL